LEVASICIVLLDPEIAPGNQTTWAFTRRDDAEAMAGFLNHQLGAGEEIAWVEIVPLAHTLNEKVLRYLDCWVEAADEARLDDE
jgi:hypothetical protein